MKGLAPVRFPCSTYRGTPQASIMKAHALPLAGLQALDSIHVQHCREACGLCVKHRAGWSVVFSGDTRPCRCCAVMSALTSAPGKRPSHTEWQYCCPCVDQLAVWGLDLHAQLLAAACPALQP